MRQQNISSPAFQTLICPVCAESFDFEHQGTPGAVCQSGHRFDFARYGYLNLLSGTPSKATPDSSAMVKARHEFLSAGHFAALSDQLHHAFAEFAPAARADSVLVDAGCGTGHYLSGLLAGPAAQRSAIGLDLSPAALRVAVRQLAEISDDPALLAVVWDLWRLLPLAARSADAVLVIFAPRNIAEFHRILRADGVLIMVTPLTEHLAGLPPIAGKLGQQVNKRAALLDAVAGYFDPLAEDEVRASLTLGRDEVLQLLMMGPSGHHVNTESLAELSEASYQVQLGFRVSVFKPVLNSPTTPAVPFPRLRTPRLNAQP